MPIFKMDLPEDGGVEGHVLIFSCENSKIATDCWIAIDRKVLDPIKKKIPQVQGQGRSPNKMVGGGILSLESNNIPTRDAQKAQTKPCVHSTQGPHKWLSQTYIQASEHLLWRHGSSVAFPGDRASGCSGPGRHSVWAPP